MHHSNSYSHLHTSILTTPFHIPQNPDEGEIADHVMLRAPHPCFNVDVEHDVPLIPSKPVTAVELPAHLSSTTV